MNKVVILTILLIIESLLLFGAINWAIDEHDLAVVRCETINLQTETINTFIDLSEEMLGTKLEKQDISECREPISLIVKNKLQELKNE